MRRLTLALAAPSLAACITLLPALAGAQTPAAKPAAKPVAKAAAPRPATSREQLRDQAKGLALATEVVEQISEGQLQAAARVMTGDVQCEFDQKITVQPVDGHPGHFHVGFKKAMYRMVPQETTTGAVRLEDKKAGIVWLQIPTKSMLMNAKVGQRMVDACQHADQRAAVAAAAAAAATPAGMQAAQATSLSIAPAAPAAPVAAVPAEAPAATAAAPASAPN